MRHEESASRADAACAWLEFHSLAAYFQGFFFYSLILMVSYCELIMPFSDIAMVKPSET